MEGLKESVSTLEKQNSTLQDSLQRERETRRTSRTSKTLDPQQLIAQLAQAPARTSVLLQTPPPTRTPHPSLRLSLPPSLPPTETTTEQPETQEEPNENAPEEKGEKEDHPELQIEQNTAQKLLGSLEEILQQTDQQVFPFTLFSALFLFFSFLILEFHIVC